MSQFRGVSFRLKIFLSFVAAKNMYYACIYSVFCMYLFNLFTQGRQTREIALSRCSKSFLQFFPSGACLFKAIKILKLKYAYKFRVAWCMYKIIKQNLYPTIQENLDLQYSQHGHSTRVSNILILPLPRVKAICINL